MGDTGGGFQYRRTGVIRRHHSDAVEILLVEEEKIKMRNKQSENYLDGKPLRNEKISWSVEDGQVTLEIENKGIWNTLFQKVLKKPRISYVHLDEMGSFIWPLLDGEKSILEIGKAVEEQFGDKANPLYERLAEYFRILESYHFIHLNT